MRIRKLVNPKYIITITAIFALLMVLTGFLVIKRTSSNMLKAIEQGGIALTEGLSLSSQNILKAGAVIEPLFSQKLIDIARFISREIRTPSREKLASIAVEYGLSRIDMFDRKGNLIMSSSPYPPDEKVCSILEPLFDGSLSEMPIGFVRDEFGIAVRGGNRVIVCYIDAEYIKDFQRETGIGSLIQKMSKEGGIEYIVLQDNDGIVFASENVSSMKSLDTDPVLMRSLEEKVTASRIYEFENHKVLEVVRPFLIDGEFFGLFRVGLSLAQYNEIARENRRHIIVLVLIIFLLGAIIVNLVVVTQSYTILDKSYKEIRGLTSSILESMGSAVIAIDSLHRITIINRSAEKLFSISRSRTIGKDYKSIFPKDECLLALTLEQGRTIGELTKTYTNLAEEELTLSLSTSTIFNPDGMIEGAVAVIRDITGLKKMEEDVREKERLSALGDLAAGVAHEIRNPLNAIGLTAQRIEQEFEPKEELEEFSKFISIIKNEIADLNKIVEQFLGLAKPMTLNLREEDINKVLDEVVNLLEGEAREKGITISRGEELRSGASPLLVEIDAEKMKRAFLNIMRNGIEAMGSGGELSLATELDNNNCRIIIKDTGCGISKENLTKIFRPYFSKKDKGTGLGLSITHQLITAHKGRIEVESTEGIGTTFIITLPLKQRGHYKGKLLLASLMLKSL